jgi:hypothetical protein
VLPFGDIPIYFNRYFFSTLSGCLDRHAGHDRASHFFCLAREQPATRKQLTLSSAISGILHFALSPVAILLLDCIIPYTNYYLPLGALAAAGLIEEILRLTGERRLAYVALGGLLVVAAMLQAFPSFPTLLRPEPEWFAWRRPNLRHSSVQTYRQRAASLSSATASKQRRRFGLPAVSSSRDLCIFRRLSAPEARAKQESVIGSTRLSGMPVCGARTACGTPSPKASVVRC